jgi:hypothetical protein
LFITCKFTLKIGIWYLIDLILCILEKVINIYRMIRWVLISVFWIATSTLLRQKQFLCLFLLPIKNGYKTNSFLQVNKWVIELGLYNFIFEFDDKVVVNKFSYITSLVFVSNFSRLLSQLIGWIFYQKQNFSKISGESQDIVKAAEWI